MEDFIQESDVNEVLNKRKRYFTPELGNVYRVETEDGEASKYAKLISIDYSDDSPYLCNVIVREAISIDGKIESPAKLEGLRFDYSGVSEDGKSTLRNLSAEDSAEYRETSDIDSFNIRSPELIVPTYKQKNALPNVVLWTLMGLAYNFMWGYYSPELSRCLNILFMLGGGLVFFFPYFLLLARKTHFVKIYVLATLFLNMFAIIQSVRSNEVGLAVAVLMTICLCSCLYLPAYCETSLLKESRRYSFMIGSFSRFVTHGGKSVVITNKFGDDNDFPMEGYIVMRQEIRNGDTVVKKAVKLPEKWDYGGCPYSHKRGSAGFWDCKLFNTPDDAKAVLDLFDRQYGIKSKGKSESVSEKAVNGDDMSKNQTSLLSKIAFIIKNMRSSKYEKIARFMLIAWVVDAVFDYKLHYFLNYIIPALAVLLAMYGARSKLKI